MEPDRTLKEETRISIAEEYAIYRDFMDTLHTFLNTKSRSEFTVDMRDYMNSMSMDKLLKLQRTFEFIELTLPLYKISITAALLYKKAEGELKNET